MFKVSCFYQKVHNFLLCRPTIVISTFSNTEVLFYKYNNEMPYTINETKIDVKFLASKLVTTEVTGKKFTSFNCLNYYRSLQS